VIFLAMQMSVVDVSLQMCFGTKAFATVWVLAAMFLRMIAYMMIQLVRLVKDLSAIRYGTCVMTARTG
jgi:hypothetical protein